MITLVGVGLAVRFGAVELSGIWEVPGAGDPWPLGFSSASLALSRSAGSSSAMGQAYSAAAGAEGPAPVLPTV